MEIETFLISLWGQIINSKLLLAILRYIFFFILGWIIGRYFAVNRNNNRLLIKYQSKNININASEDAFRRGLSYLMADHADKAIEEFIRVVSINSDTVETYIILGNLFRQKGEIERAVRIRQTIIARPNLHSTVRLQALYDLGLDYRKGGLFNRAVEAFQKVLIMDPRHIESSRQLVFLFEEVREWDKAYEEMKRLDKLKGSNSKTVLAHYKTEIAKEYLTNGQLELAEERFNQAIEIYKKCLDAYLHLGDLELIRGKIRRALGVWRKAIRLAPLHAHLVFTRIIFAEEKIGQQLVIDFFIENEIYQTNSFSFLVLSEYYYKRKMDQKALELLKIAIEKDPKQLGLHYLRGKILLANKKIEKLTLAFDDLLEQINNSWYSYHCYYCGFVSHQLIWKCPRCYQWDTVIPFDRCSSNNSSVISKNYE